MPRLSGVAEGTGVPTLAAACAAVLVASPFLPWFATDLGPPFASESTSGWEGTSLARLVLVLGVVVLVANTALALDAAGRMILDGRLAVGLAGLATGLGAIALLLVLYRTAFLPEPDFLSRDIGLYVAAASAAAATALSAAQLAPRAATAPGR